MSTETLRFVDPHVHWWDRGNDWMITATQEQADAFGMGDISAMAEAYFPADYAADAASSRVEVPEVVWVTANLGPEGALPEVLWVEELPEPRPKLGAVIGSVDPSLGAGELEAALGAQNVSERFRGVRWLGGLDHESAEADRLIDLLAAAGLLYDLVAHQEVMPAAARLAERHPEVPFVLEHCGWPMAPNDPDYVEAWRGGISALAEVETVSCKISGLAMSVHGFEPEAQRPFVEHCLQAFGVERCMFASNFPVDRLYGSYADLVELYLTLSEPLGAEAQAQLFHRNAERIYRLG